MEKERKSYTKRLWLVNKRLFSLGYIMMVDIERDDNGLHFSCPQCGEYLGVSYEYLEEKTCHVVQVTRYDYEFSYAGTEYVTELSCGHKYVDSYGDAPDYCPWCGAKVVD